MLRELVRIPIKFHDVDLFGAGVLLAVWIIVAVVSLAVVVRRHGWNANTLGYLPLFIVVAGVIYFLPRLFPEGLPIRGYGVMMLLGVTSGVGLAMHRARRVGLDPEVIVALAFWVFLSGIAGGRAFYVWEYWHKSFAKDTWSATIAAVLNIPDGGLVVYGAFLAVLVAVAAFVWKHRLPGLALADLIAPSLPLGLAFGRIGCLFSGCCYGDLCELPWAVRFPQRDDPPVYVNQLYRGLQHGFLLEGNAEKPPAIVWIDPQSPAARAGLRQGDVLKSINGQPIPSNEEERRGLIAGRSLLQVETADGRALQWSVEEPPPAASRPVHPVQVYSAVTAALLCAFLLAYEPFRRRDGELLALMLTIYPVARFLEEAIRVDEPAVYPTPFSVSQNVSLALFAGAIGLWVFIARRPIGMTYRRG